MRLIQNQPKVLMVYPRTPDSYWGFRGAVRYVGAKSASPPLGLMTVAGLLPAHFYIHRIIDLDVEDLTDEQIAWADYVMLTGMIVHRESIQQVICRCQGRGMATIVGGPFASSMPEAEELGCADAVVVGELEDSRLLSCLVEDMERGSLKKFYRASAKPDLKDCAVPRYDLVDHRNYAAMSIQISRGCPFECEFCDIHTLYGRRPRYKTAKQIRAELSALYCSVGRKNVFVVDDNLIGNIQEAESVANTIATWQNENGRPFAFYTEADIRVASRPSLVSAMVRAGFFAIFTGFESPSTEALRETGKNHNVRHSEKMSVSKSISFLRSKGLLVYGGFILGFDSDGPDCFAAMERFICENNIDFAMVGPLIAIYGTQLERRIRAEGRLLFETDGNPFRGSNILPKKMSRVDLLSGYRRLLLRLYTPESFFKRAYGALEQWCPAPVRKPVWREWLAAVRSVVRQGVLSSYRREYWRFMTAVFKNSPRKIPRAIAMAISGDHFFDYTGRVVVPELKKTETRVLAEESAALRLVKGPNQN